MARNKSQQNTYLKITTLHIGKMHILKGRCIYQGGEEIVLIKKLCFFYFSLWLFWCMIKLLTCFTLCLLDHNLLVTLYLSFYYLLYLEGLMCFVQVFQVTGIYVPSSSQLVWLMIRVVIWEREKKFSVILTMFLLCS